MTACAEEGTGKINNFLQSLQQSWVRLLVHGAGVVLTLHARWLDD